MTDSVVEFRYIDDVHIVSVYFRSDSFLKDFIKNLQKIVKKCERVSYRKGWDYTVTQMVAHLINVRQGEGIAKFCAQQEKPNVIFHHVICVEKEYYDNKENYLIDFITIKSIYPIGGEMIYSGKLKDFKEPKEKK